MHYAYALPHPTPTLLRTLMLHISNERIRRISHRPDAIGLRGRATTFLRMPLFLQELITHLLLPRFHALLLPSLRPVHSTLAHRACMSLLHSLPPFSFISTAFS